MILEDNKSIAYFLYFLKKIGITPGITYYFASKSWSLISIPITISIITFKFTPETQGYYYTMISLTMLQVLVEFGFSTVLMQFVSHEWAKLQIIDGEVIGDIRAKARLASLLRLSILWIIGVTGVLTLTLAAGGYWFFTSSPAHPEIHWQGPWFLLCAGVAINLVGTMMRGITDGCNMVALGQKTGLFASIIANLFIWIGLLSGVQLYAAPLMQMTQGVLTITFLGIAIRPILKLARHPSDEHKVHWYHEFWRQQWRIGVSWGCGLIVFQSFSPFLFHFQGPVEAGRFGLLIQIWQFANALSFAWLINAQPQLGMFWADGRIAELRILVKSIIFKAYWTAGIAVVSALILIFVIGTELPHYRDRLPSLLVCTIMLSVVILNQGAAVRTAAIRCNKQEPFLYSSIIIAILMIISNIIGATTNMLNMAIGYWLIDVGVMIPWVNMVYRKHAIRNV